MSLLKEVKEWLEVSYDDEDDTIESLIADAKNYIYNATGKEYDDNKPMHKRCLIFLVTQWFENREPTGKQDKAPFSLESMLLQIQYGDES